MISTDEAQQILLDLTRYWDFTLENFVRFGELPANRVVAIRDGRVVATRSERDAIEMLWNDTPVGGSNGLATRRWCPEPPPDWDNIIRAYEDAPRK